MHVSDMVTDILSFIFDQGISLVCLTVPESYSLKASLDLSGFNSSESCFRIEME